MPVQVSITDALIHGRKLHELEQAVYEGIIIRDYLKGEISLGELAELMNMKYLQASKGVVSYLWHRYLRKTPF